MTPDDARPGSRVTWADPTSGSGPGEILDVIPEFATAIVRWNDNDYAALQDLDELRLVMRLLPDNASYVEERDHRPWEVELEDDSTAEDDGFAR